MSDEEGEGSPFLSRRRLSRDREKSVSVVNYDSHQYEQEESDIWWHFQLQRVFSDRGRWWTSSKSNDFYRWSFTLLIGLCCGLTALIVTSATHLFSSWKFNTFHRLIELEKDSFFIRGSSFAFLLAIDLLYGSIAYFTVLMEPLAAGSGIPEIKCFLNGLNISNLLRLRTLWWKAIGLVFACAAGLPLGKEGPMVHIGAVIAAFISQDFWKDYSSQINTGLNSEKERRDFVACGAACGVAAAFGAPIGGVLFSLEEGASFWSTNLTWRCFCGAMSTVFFLYVFTTARRMFGHSDSTAMFSFGEFFSLQGEQSNYSVWELSLFIIVGCMGGILGAGFNRCTRILFHYRKKYSSKFYHYLDVVCIVLVSSGLSILLSLSWQKCTPLPVDMEGWSEQERSLVSQLVPLYCNDEMEYNELASMMLTDSDTSIRQLFHFREIGDHANNYTFSTAALLLFFLKYFAMACVTYGSAVPAGMFVPSLLSGAAFGRLLGHLLHKLDAAHGTFADSGTYALMGAAAVTSGITRMTISLTVMILEATGDMQYVLPLMLTVLSARFIGNIFTEGLNEMNIHSRQLPYLDENENVTRLSRLEDLRVTDAMTSKPVCVQRKLSVKDIASLVDSNQHNCFPVVDDDDNALIGSITRLVLERVINAFVQNDPLPGRLPQDRILSQSQINGHTSNDQLVDNMTRNISETAQVDIGPYMDSAPYTVNENSSLLRAHRMFRTLGLRHLFVINNRHQLLGIVTRADLVKAESQF